MCGLLQAHPISTNAPRHRECPHGLLPRWRVFLHALLPAHPLPAARQGLDQSPLAHREHAKTDVISLTDKKSVLMHQHEQAEHCFVGLVCTTARCVREDGVVIMIDLEEIDLSAAPCTNARKIRAGKKNVAKILARARSMPSWKRSLASVRGKKTRSSLGLKVISVEERFVEQHGIRRDWINPR